MMGSHNSHRIKSKDIDFDGKVIYRPQSIVFDQTENRLHVQKAIILFLLGKMD